MTIYTTPIEQISDGNGDPISGAKKFLFNAGTTTKKTIYSDSALKKARANPVLSDADGRFPQFFLAGLYDEEQQDNTGTATGYDGATLWGPLPVGEVAEGALTLWATDNTYDIPEIVLGSNDNYYRSLTDSNTGNNPVSSPGSWELLRFGRVWNTNITYAKNNTAYGDDGYLYISIQGSNKAKSPALNSGWWRPATNQNQSAIAAGTVDAITAVMPIPLQSLNDETMVTIRASGANTITNPTFAPDGLAAKTIVKNGNQALNVGDIFGVDHEMQLKYNINNNKWELMNPAIILPVDLPPGSVVQKESIILTTSSTGTTLIPFDDTIPQNTEGDEYLSLSFTPKLNDSILYIEFDGSFTNSATGIETAALFKDTDADAIAAGSIWVSSAAIDRLNFSKSMVSGTTSSITFKIRAGGAVAGTTTINGFTGTRRLGGVLVSSLIITEVKA